jgi:hypothetical protein
LYHFILLLNYIRLHYYIILYCIILHYIICIYIYDIKIIILHYITLYYIVLHYITLYYIILHYITFKLFHIILHSIIYLIYFYIIDILFQPNKLWYPAFFLLTKYSHGKTFTCQTIPSASCPTAKLRYPPCFSINPYLNPYLWQQLSWL